jgi:hypothetical protein
MATAPSIYCPTAKVRSLFPCAPTPTSSILSWVEHDPSSGKEQDEQLPTDGHRLRRIANLSKTLLRRPSVSSQGPPICVARMPFVVSLGLSKTLEPQGGRRGGYRWSDGGPEPGAVAEELRRCGEEIEDCNHGLAH